MDVIMHGVRVGCRGRPVANAELMEQMRVMQARLEAMELASLTSHIYKGRRESFYLYLFTHFMLLLFLEMRN